MPKYAYRCTSCSGEYEIWHGMTEEHTQCEICDAPVVRVPSILGEVVVGKPDKAGTIVNQKIEDTKREVESYKEESSRSLDL